MKRFTKNARHMVIAFVGWMLSPATWWNDTFVNIPIAYFLASVLSWVWSESFNVALIAFYVGTNILGSWLLYLGGRELIKPVIKPPRQWLQIVLIIVYCAAMSVLVLKDIVRPIRPPHHEN
ncbi:MAG: hypothetical protein EXS18_02650 [Verrucomicrobiae bacterium]|nr:hypothetical protein [Verrucomicrobiae bacterium]